MMSSKQDFEGLVSRKSMKSTPVIPIHSKKDDQVSSNGNIYSKHIIVLFLNLLKLPELDTKVYFITYLIKNVHSDLLPRFIWI